MRNYFCILISTCILIFGSCIEENEFRKPDNNLLAINGMTVDIDGMVSDASLRATGEYAVNNTAEDPTYTMTGREAWELDVQIYGGDTLYVDGSATFVWNSGNTWTPTSDIYFPNYTRQRVSAQLHPAAWTEIAFDQSAADGSGLFGQDVLEQDGNNYITVLPAHIPNIPLRHAHSMLDFRLENVNEADIDSVTVIIGTDIYYPYQVRTGDYPEYMVIIPVGTSEPVVRVRTTEGARYLQTVDKVTNSAVNTCYCFTLSGLELSLAEITIANWTTGVGIAGEYTLEQSYPTFRGEPSTTCTVGYDNGLSQVLLFNEQGETTQQPAGRTIISFTSSNTGLISIDPPLVLRGMIVDLTSYFQVQ